MPTCCANTTDRLDTASDFQLNVAVEGAIRTPTARLVETGLRFGIPLETARRVIASNMALRLQPGTITLVTGPSGSGKSQILKAVATGVAHSRLVHQVSFPLDVSVLDAVGPTRPLYEVMGTLTACGLGEPMLWIRSFEQLSDGEQFRARLARAVAMHQRTGLRGPLLCDEFGAILHRRLAKAIAFNLRKLVSRERLTLIVATSQSDLEQDLQADQIVRLPGPHGGDQSPALLAGQPQQGQRVSFAGDLRIEPGRLQDYRRFSPMHYRQRDHLGFIDRTFVMKDRATCEPLGIIMYAHPALEISLRNRATGGRFCRQAHRLNRELRVIRRLVIHPDVRGCGLGHWLVKQTLPLAGVRFVECLAAMGAVNPIFDKAGMQRVGTIEPPPARQRILQVLRHAGVDPLAADFVNQVCRRPTIRKLVTRSVNDWYRSTTGNPQRAERLSPMALAQTFRQSAGSQPVYFIWARDEAGRALLRSHQPDVRDDEPTETA